MAGGAEYTEPQLLRLIALAEDLGFSDDVAHWSRILKDLRAERRGAR